MCPPVIAVHAPRSAPAHAPVRVDPHVGPRSIYGGGVGPTDARACDAVRESMAHLNQLDALYAFLVAAAVTALLTPFTMRLGKGGRRCGRTARARPLQPRHAVARRSCDLRRCARRGARRSCPRAMGRTTQMWHGVLIAAALITVVGALDDRFDLPPIVKLAGQIAAAVIVVHYGVAVKSITLPFVGTLHFPKAGATNAGPALTVIGLVVMMNIVNLSDGVDGLAAGVCVIIAGTLAIIAFDLDRAAPGVLAALTAGAALGFLVHNFPPASSFMGDCGANLLGLLMGVVAVEAAVKTAGGRVVRAASDPAHRPLPGHHVRGAQAPEVPPPHLRRRQRALPPSHGPHRLLLQTHDRLPVRVDADARRLRARAAVRALLRPQRSPAYRLDTRDGGARAARRRRQRLPRVRA